LERDNKTCQSIEENQYLFIMLQRNGIRVSVAKFHVTYPARQIDLWSGCADGLCLAAQCFVSKKKKDEPGP